MAKGTVSDEMLARREMALSSAQIACELRSIATDVDRLGKLAWETEQPISEAELCEIADVYLAVAGAMRPLFAGSKTIARLLGEQPSAPPSSQS